MILLFDIGNTHTHIGLADERRVVKQTDISTLMWFGGGAAALVKKFAGENKIEGAILCSVVPRATPLVKKLVRAAWKINALELNSATTGQTRLCPPRSPLPDPIQSSGVKPRED